MHWSKPLEAVNPPEKTISTAPITNRGSTLVQFGKGLIEQSSHGQEVLKNSNLRQSQKSPTGSGLKKYGYR